MCLFFYGSFSLIGYYFAKYELTNGGFKIVVDAIAFLFDILLLMPYALSNWFYFKNVEDVLKRKNRKIQTSRLKNDIGSEFNENKSIEPLKNISTHRFHLRFLIASLAFSILGYLLCLYTHIAGLNRIFYLKDTPLFFVIFLCLVALTAISGFVLAIYANHPSINLNNGTLVRFLTSSFVLMMFFFVNSFFFAKFNEAEHVTAFHPLGICIHMVLMIFGLVLSDSFTKAIISSEKSKNNKGDNVYNEE